MNKKIAVIITGHMRSFEECWPSWLNIVSCNKFNCDYYVHTYDSITNSLDSSGRVHAMENNEHVIQTYINEINPISYVIDNENKFYEQHIRNSYEKLASLNPKVYTNRLSNAKTQFFMFKKMQLGFQLCSNVDFYDLVIRLRPDTLWKNNVIFPDNIDSKLITISRGPTPQPPDAACDLFGFMTNKVAKIYFNTYDSLINRAISGRMRRYNAEIHLGMQMVENNISIEEIHCQDFGLKRRQ